VRDTGYGVPSQRGPWRLHVATHPLPLGSCRTAGAGRRWSRRDVPGGCLLARSAGGGDGLSRLETLAARQAAEAQDLDLVTELNSTLHRRISDIGGNRWLSTLSVSLYRHVEWVFRLGVAHRAPHSWTEHVRLVEAIASGDPEVAERAAAEHVGAAAAAALPGAVPVSPPDGTPGVLPPLSAPADRDG
jgi:hypothetical protein